MKCEACGQVKPGIALDAFGREIRPGNVVVAVCLKVRNRGFSIVTEVESIMLYVDEIEFDTQNDEGTLHLKGIVLKNDGRQLCFTPGEKIENIYKSANTLSIVSRVSAMVWQVGSN